MKTGSSTTRKLPKPYLLTVYLCAVLVLGSMNWVAVRLENSEEKIQNLESVLTDTLVEEQEPGLQLEDAKLNLATDHLTGTTDGDIHVESWMMNPERYNHADSYIEGGPIADWMLCTIGWTCCELLARK